MEGEDGGDSLARFRREAEQASRSPKQGWHGSLEHTVDVWQRFTAGTGWEKSRFGIAALLMVGVVITAIYLLATSGASGGDGEEQVVALPTRAQPTVTRASPTPTTIAAVVPTVSPARPTARNDCDAIRGTDYTNATERAFFQQNCVTPTEEPANEDIGQIAVDTPAPPLPTEPSGPHSLSAGDAIDLAVVWITHDAPGAYTTGAGSCSSSERAGHWLVTCTASLLGCQGSVCQTRLSVCVFAEPVEVRPSAQC